MSGLALPSTNGASGSWTNVGNAAKGERGASEVEGKMQQKAVASVPEITAVQGLVPTLQ